MPVKTPVPQIQKVFCFFFSKKKSLPHRIELTDQTVIGHTGWYYLVGRHRRRVSALVTTITLDAAMAAPARTGLR